MQGCTESLESSGILVSLKHIIFLWLKLPTNIKYLIYAIQSLCRFYCVPQAFSKEGVPKSNFLISQPKKTCLNEKVLLST